MTVPPNLLGQYGPWAASLAGDEPGRLSLRSGNFNDLDAWRARARQRVEDLLAQPDLGPITPATVHETTEHDGLYIEHLSWQLPYGPPTRAVFLKPAGAAGPLPGILGLHDHGGNKYFGLEKITHTGDQHPLMREHRDQFYGGKAWANEAARRGYAVMVHDVFPFASRGVNFHELPDYIKHKVPHQDDRSRTYIDAYNRFASEHESYIAKGLFCAGTTWPGVTTAEDQRAVDYLCARPDVDEQRTGCAGLSGGGLRTAHLAGLDDRIRCACCVGLMSTWRDFLLNKSHTHTWMIYIPGLARDLDYPEVYGLRVPRPTMVLNNLEDPLFTLPQVQRADRILREVFEKAGAGDKYRCSFYPGPHKFDVQMQEEAFGWFDSWLRA